MLRAGSCPVGYRFTYDYAEPKGDRPIGASVEVAGCPWNTHNRLVRIGVKAADPGEAPGPANLVFLVDVSGSMRPDNKLPLLRQGLRMMVERMTRLVRVTACRSETQLQASRARATGGPGKASVRRPLLGNCI